MNQRRALKQGVTDCSIDYVQHKGSKAIWHQKETECLNNIHKNNFFKIFKINIGFQGLKIYQSLREETSCVVNKFL